MNFKGLNKNVITWNIVVVIQESKKAERKTKEIIQN